jgi:hypothetical protein
VNAIHLRSLLLGAAIGCSSLIAIAEQPKKPAAPTTAQLEQRIKELESRLEAAELKAKAATLDTAYLRGIQKDAKDYYDKAFDTQVKYLEGLMILVAAVPALFGFLGFRIIDRTIEHAVSKATTELETKFDRRLADELQKLKDSNTAQMKQLDEDLSLKSIYSYYLLQGLALAVDNQHVSALAAFLEALDASVRDSTERGTGRVETAFSEIEKTRFGGTSGFTTKFIRRSPTGGLAKGCSEKGRCLNILLGVILDCA